MTIEYPEKLIIPMVKILVTPLNILPPLASSPSPLFFRFFPSTTFRALPLEVRSIFESFFFVYDSWERPGRVKKEDAQV